MPTGSAAKTCLVIGGAGFIGTHLCRAIAGGSEDVQLTVLDDLSGSAVDRERFRALVPDADLIVGDGAAPPRRVRETGWDLIINLASACGPVAVLAEAGRIGPATLDILQSTIALARAGGGRLIYVSTSEVYGSAGDVDEASPAVFGARASARQEYALSKRLAETVLANAWHVDPSAFSYQIVRPFNVAGPLQRADKGFVMPRFIGQARADAPLTVYGDGAQRRAFLHVEDACRALIVLAGTQTCNRTWNLGCAGNTLSIRDLALRVIDRVGGGRLDFVDPVALHGAAFSDAPSKIPAGPLRIEALGWAARRDIDAIIDDIRHAL